MDFLIYLLLILDLQNIYVLNYRLKKKAFKEKS
jgi:hypothetical protein